MKSSDFSSNASRALLRLPPGVASAQKTSCSDRGQAVLEALLSLTVGVALIFLLLNVIYFAFLKNQIEYLSYESLVCKISAPAPHSLMNCEQVFERKLKALLPFGQIRSTYFSKSGQQFRIRVTLNFINLSTGPLYQWTLQKSLDSKLSAR